MSFCVPSVISQATFLGRAYGLGPGLLTFTAWQPPERSGVHRLPSLDAHPRGRTTFTVREALHRSVLDSSGARWGSVSDFALHAPGSLAVDLILRDGGDCRVPAPGVLALDRDALVANLHDRDRIRGGRAARELWLAKDVIGRTALLLPSGERARVADVRLAMVDGRTAIVGVTVTLSHRWHRSSEEVGWSDVVHLGAIEAGVGLPHHAAHVRTLDEPARRLIIEHLKAQAADALGRAVGSPLPLPPDDHP